MPSRPSMDGSLSMDCPWDRARDVAAAWARPAGRGPIAGGVALTLALLAAGSTAGAASLSIMPLGDSITYGYSAKVPAPGGYRAPLYRDLVAAGYDVRFVGSQTTNPDPSLP